MELLSSREHALEQLFQAWRKKRISEHPFVRDGINKESEWELTSPKILFILKEAVADKDEPDWDLRTHWSNGAVKQGRNSSSTSGPLCRWIDGILNRNCADWLSIKDISYSRPEQRAHLFQKVATMNLKKIGGGSSSNISEIEKYTIEDRDFISDEINIISPDVVICCGTYHLVKAHIADISNVYTTNNGIEWAVPKNANYSIISYYHPQVRWPHNFLYSMLMSAFHEAKDLRNQMQG